MKNPGLKIQFNSCLIWALLGASTLISQAFTYKDTDLLLIFRQAGYPDVEFNIGSVSNFLGRANGAVVNITNWNYSLVYSNFDGSMDSVQFLLAAVAGNDNLPKRAWLTDGSSTGTPTDVSGSRIGIIWSKVNNVGNQAQLSTLTNNQNVYAIDSSDPSSYTYLVSEAGKYDVSTMGGGTLFPVESGVPATNRFFEVDVSNLTIKPNATQLGVFSLDENGVLKFTAGQPITVTAPDNVRIARGVAPGTVTVSFSTVAGLKYKLVYTSGLSSTVTWTDVSGTIFTGTGGTGILNDDSGQPHRFYKVVASQ